MTSSKKQSWQVIAETGELFRDFAPYVPAINGRGVVAFQAERPDGTTGIFVHDGAQLSTAIDSLEGPFASFNSHPDINDDGALSFYTARQGDAGIESVALVQDGDHALIAQAPGALKHIGPLGPTMCDRGAPAVAFRAMTNKGTQQLYFGEGNKLTTVADIQGDLCGFQGLPAIDRGDGGVVSVAFRADRNDGGQGIYCFSDATLLTSTVAETGAEFAQLGFFPSLVCTGYASHVAFAATLQDGHSGVFVWSSDEERCVARFLTSAPEASHFASIRGALIDGRGEIIFFATPKSGGLGVYRAPQDEPLLATDQPFASDGREGIVASFALNPVSINRQGQLVARVKLRDGRQLIAAFREDGR